MKYIKSIFSGLLIGILAWLFLSIADAFDEYILNTDSFIGIIIFFGFPITMYIKYILHYIKEKPKHKMIILWLGSYSAVFVILWWNIYNKIVDNEYIIKQINRTDWITLNGAEYIFYGYSALIGYSIMCIFFHLVYMITRKQKRN